MGALSSQDQNSCFFIGRICCRNNGLPGNIQSSKKKVQNPQVFAKDKQMKKQRVLTISQSVLFFINNEQLNINQSTISKSSSGKKEINFQTVLDRLHLPYNSSYDDKKLYNILKSYKDLLQMSLAQRALEQSCNAKNLQNFEIIYENPQDKFEFGEALGEGSYCKILLAAFKRKSQKYAVKIFQLQSEEIPKYIKKEIVNLTTASSKYTVKIRFLYFFDKKLYMFMDYMNYGSLRDFIDDNFGKINEGVIAYIIKQILEGLSHIHDMNIIHRDIKAENILVNKNGQIKIADFGFAIHHQFLVTEKNKILGTPGWIAPQIILKKQYDERIDIWSLGMVIIELCNGIPPCLLSEQTMSDILYCTIRNEAPRINGFSEQLQNFVSCMLQKDPKRRIKCHTLLNHPFIKINEHKANKEKFIQMLKKA